MGGKDKGMKEIPLSRGKDHINGNKLDNRRENLRVCTLAENNRNRTIYKNNKSGFKGVYWSRADKKWRAQIKINNRMIYLGIFDDLLEAALTYDEAAVRYHGKFAKINFE